MHGVVGETDNGRQKTEIMVMTSLAENEELFTDYSITLANLSLNAPTGAGHQLLSRWWDAYRKQLGLKDFCKSQDAGIAAD